MSWICYVPEPFLLCSRTFFLQKALLLLLLFLVVMRGSQIWVKVSPDRENSYYMFWICTVTIAVPDYCMLLIVINNFELYFPFEISLCGLRLSGSHVGLQDNCCSICLDILCIINFMHVSKTWFWIALNYLRMSNNNVVNSIHVLSAWGDSNNSYCD